MRVIPPPKPPLSRMVSYSGLRYAICPLCSSTMKYRFVLFGRRKCIHPECGHTEG
jgi:formate dehydrogenase maturation protein FdhE